MIAVKLIGGLGNQMFEYAAARHLATLHNSQVVMDLSWFDNIDQKDTQRVYELDQFKLNQNFLQPGSFLLLEAGQSPAVRGLKRLRHRNKPSFTEIKERHFHFDKSLLGAKDNSYLNGYWQSYKYFQASRQVLLEDFSFRPKPRPKIAKLMESVGEVESVALHIRRGDYVSNVHAASFHGLMDLSYYQRASRLIAKKHPKLHVFVFSDDPDWCRENLKLDFPTSFIPKGHSGPEDLRIMVNCKHIITANSSFSWWGAWLNDNPGKIVVSPKQWFKNPDMDSKDLVPNDWIRL